MSEHQLAEQADHLRDATKMVHDDQSGDATEMISYPDEVGEDEGPWRASNRWRGFWIATKRDSFSEDVGATFRVSEWGEDSARAKAEQAASELNAKHREEQAAREQEAEKQRRIAAFVGMYKNNHCWFWGLPPDEEFWIGRSGIAYNCLDESRMLIPRAELEAALRAAVVEELVTLSPELRILSDLVQMNVGDIATLSDTGAAGFPVLLKSTELENKLNQARAFLREKGVAL